ncbi:MAG TPA: SCO family protein [Steroidobacteraceae bacterium]
MLSAALAAGGLSACTESDGPRFHAKDITGVLPALTFQLTAGSGRTLTAADVRGKTTLLYFGYTQCPDACPMTLTYIDDALKQLGAEAGNVRVLFVSVDPQRDTPQVLKRYAATFGSEFIGLTGTDDQLTRVTKRYRVAYRRDTPDSNGDYTVYHSSAVFVFDRDGHARLLATPTGTNDGLAADLKTLIDQRSS